MYEEFSALGVQIVGVTFGNASSNRDWVQSEGFQYEVWSDSNKDLAVYYGAAANHNAFVPNRVTRLLDGEGNLLLEYNSVDINSSPAKVLEDCQLIFGQ